VKYRLAITHISRTARASKPVIARGSLLPADRNVRITLYQVSKAGKLHRLVRARTDAHGKWTAKWRMVKGRYKIVAAVASQRYDLGNRSATVRVRRT
jgi:hypothetical protein